MNELIILFSIFQYSTQELKFKTFRHLGVNKTRNN